MAYVTSSDTAFHLNPPFGRFLVCVSETVSLLFVMSDDQHHKQHLDNLVLQ